MNLTPLRIAILSVFGAVIVVVGLILQGERAAIRYADTACPYYLIYENEGPVDLLGIGGSRMLTAFDADHIGRVLSQRGQGELVVYNASHSHYVLEKELTIFRDFVENRRVRNAVIMLQPRENDVSVGRVNEEFAAIASIRDIPVTLRATSHESGMVTMRTGLDVLQHRLSPPDALESCLGQEKPRGICRRWVTNDAPHRNCHAGDYRTKLDVLLANASRLQSENVNKFNWSLAAAEQKFTEVLVREFVRVARSNDVNLFFLFVARATQAVPEAAASEAFEAKFGVPLLIPPDEIVMKIARMGTRDITHIYEPGRDIYLPWLIDEIENKCPAGKHCLSTDGSRNQ